MEAEAFRFGEGKSGLGAGGLAGLVGGREWWEATLYGPS